MLLGLQDFDVAQIIITFAQICPNFTQICLNFAQKNFRKALNGIASTFEWLDW